MSKRKTVFIIGTIAELIKLYPVLDLYRKCNYPFAIIATGQQNLGASSLSEVFEASDFIQLPVIKTSTISGFLFWSTRLLFRAIWAAVIQRRSARIAVVHGDTVSALVGSVAFKICRFKIAHVESGLSSGNIRYPFPEEACRRIISFFSDICFAPNEWAARHLNLESKVVINTGSNTLYDMLNHDVTKDALKSPLPEKLKHLPDDFCLAALHRQENVLSGKSIKKFVDSITLISKEIHVVLIGHELTLNALKKHGLLDCLQQPNVTITPRLDYFVFIKLMVSSVFVMSDGGSNQEESYYLGKRMFILRSVTERIEGMETTAIMAGHLEPVDILTGYRALKHQTLFTVNFPKPLSASRMIVDTLQKHIKEIR